MRIHGIVWLILLFASLLLSPLIVSPEHYRGLIAAEMMQTGTGYGARESLEINRRGDALYRLLMVKTGFESALTASAVPSAPANDLIMNTVERAGHVRQLESVVLGYTPGLLQSFYLFCLRLSHSWCWFAWLSPFLAALILDGLMTRRAKLRSFEYTHPTVYNLSWHLIIAVFAASLVAYSLVASLPLLLFPAVWVFSGTLLRMLISNIQHSA